MIDRPQPTSALRETEVAQRLRRLFETDLLGIIFYRYDGGITEANEAFLRMVGHSRLDLEQGRIDWAAMTPPEMMALDAAKVAEVQTAGTCEPYEKEYILRDGSRLPVLVGAAAVDEDGGVAFVLDLSEQHALRRERDALLSSADSRLTPTRSEPVRSTLLERRLSRTPGRPKSCT